MTERDLARRFRQAEKLTLRDRPPERKYKWLKAHCTHCGALVQYAPKKYFRGGLYCGSCGKSFHLTRLEDFMEEAKRNE